MRSPMQLKMRSENPVFSLEVHARAESNPVPSNNEWKVLIGHFFQRFFDNETISLGEQKQTRIIQILCALAQPGLIVGLYIMAASFPDRPYWLQAADHYFYVTYSLVATGVVTVFEWDLLFPDLLDVLVLGYLPIQAGRILRAKIAALGIFLGLFLFSTNILGTILFPLVARQPSLAHHFLTHSLAVAVSGIFAATVFLSLQGILLNLLGARLFRLLSPLLQALGLTVLLLLLFLTPLFSQYLRALLSSGSKAVLYFPPFWFLGIYERLLAGPSALPVFHVLAKTGCWITLLSTTLTILTYPLAYRRRTRQVIEGVPRPATKNWIRRSGEKFLNCFYLRNPARRAIYHFISQTLLRTPKHRVYLAVHCGLALALVIAGVIAFRFQPGEIIPVFSTYGLRASLPILAFWLISGLQITMRSPVEVRASWIFTLINSGPDPDYSAAIDRWVLARVILITVAASLTAGVLSPQMLGGGLQMALQLLIAVAVPFALTKFFFHNFFSVPFCVPADAGKRNLPFVLLLYIVVFPPLVGIVANLGPWMAHSARHMVEAVITLFIMVFALDWNHRRMIRERRGWIATEEPEDGFQRLGLS